MNPKKLTQKMFFVCGFSINGIPACLHKQLLIDIVRNEWGFNGYISSDAGAIDYIITKFKYLTKDLDAAVEAVKAGCNIELGSRLYTNLIKATKQGNITEHEIR